MARPPRRKNLKPPGNCIFCSGASGSSLSKEHVLPNWLRVLFPRNPADTHTHGITSWVELSPGGLTPVTVRRKKQGQASTKRVRVVCERCNNGWLSQLETRTKPLLFRLIRAERVVLGSDEQSLLAVWAAKTIMTAEFVERDKVAIPQTNRTSLMQTLSPPNAGWWIWIA